MADQGPVDALSTTRQFVLVVRVVLRPDGGLHGELLDPETDDTYPFVGAAGLTQKVEHWLAVFGTRRGPAMKPSGSQPMGEP